MEMAQLLRTPQSGGHGGLGAETEPHVVTGVSHEKLQG